MRYANFAIAVIVVVLLAGAAFSAFAIADTAQDDAAQENATVTNETLTQEAGTYQLVSQATDEFTTGFNDSVTVYNSSDVELTAGADYRWNATDGAILFESSPRTQDGASANITYQYQQNTAGVQEVSGPLNTITANMGLLATLGGGVSLVVFVLAFGGLIAKHLGSGPQTRR